MKLLTEAETETVGGGGSVEDAEAFELSGRGLDLFMIDVGGGLKLPKPPQDPAPLPAA